MVQALSHNGDIFQDDNAPIQTTHVVKFLNEEHESELEPEMSMFLILKIKS